MLGMLQHQYEIDTFTSISSLPTISQPEIHSKTPKMKSFLI